MLHHCVGVVVRVVRVQSDRPVVVVNQTQNSVRRGKRVERIGGEVGEEVVLPRHIVGLKLRVGGCGNNRCPPGRERAQPPVEPGRQPTIRPDRVSRQNERDRRQLRTRIHRSLEPLLLDRRDLRALGIPEHDDRIVRRTGSCVVRDRGMKLTVKPLEAPLGRITVGPRSDSGERPQLKFLGVKRADRDGRVRSPRRRRDETTSNLRDELRRHQFVGPMQDQCLGSQQIQVGRKRPKIFGGLRHNQQRGRGNRRKHNGNKRCDSRGLRRELVRHQV